MRTVGLLFVFFMGEWSLILWRSDVFCGGVLEQLDIPLYVVYMC